MKIISGHQPCYLPWLGLFHKLSLCDVFVYMDTVQYLEQDWNNRNKIRHSNGWGWLTVPIDHKNSRGRNLEDILINGHDQAQKKDFWQTIHWKSICAAYGKSKYFKNYESILYAMYCENIWTKLNDLCWAQFEMFIQLLDLECPKIVKMSEFEFEGCKDELVLDHCKKIGGDAVVFGMMGSDYVRPKIFTEQNIRGYFQNYNHPVYEQRFNGFESHMSILDLLLNCGPCSKDILLNGNVSKEDLRSNMYWDF